MRFSEGPWVPRAHGVEAQRRGDVLFLLNHSDRATEMAGVVGTDRLSSQASSCLLYTSDAADEL